MTTREWLIGAALLGVLVVAMGAQAAWFTVLGPRVPTIDRLTHHEAVLLVRAEEQRLYMLDLDWRNEDALVRQQPKALRAHLARRAMQTARVAIAEWAATRALVREEHLMPAHLVEALTAAPLPEPTR